MDLKYWNTIQGYHMHVEDIILAKRECLQTTFEPSHK